METKELQDIFQWDVRNWSKALPFWKKFIPQGDNLQAAAFGEREGGLSLWLAQCGFKVECSDHYNDLNDAVKLHRKYNVNDKINYSAQNITQINFKDNYFDVVIFKSVVGALMSQKDQQQAFAELHRVLKPGGTLLFAENLTASKVHQYARKKYTSWGKRWNYLSLTDTKEMLKPFKEINFKTHGFLGVFGRKESQKNMLGRIDSGTNSIIPKNWRYILFGACIK